MAWKKAYAGTYNPTATSAEESHFTRGFTEPMVQLDPAKTIVQSSHMHNTYSKKDIIQKLSYLHEISAEGTEYIPAAYLDRLFLALK